MRNRRLNEWLNDWLAAPTEALIADRRHLHAHPELRGQAAAPTEVNR